jgi:hypothetical protein
MPPDATPLPVNARVAQRLGNLLLAGGVVVMVLTLGTAAWALWGGP